VAESLSSKSDLWRTDKSSASMIREWRNYGDHCIRERERESERERVRVRAREFAFGMFGEEESGKKEWGF
jgi:hypothetical protein